MNIERKSFLITGVSRGLGCELAHLLCQRGAFVLGTVRSERDVPQFAQEYPELFIPIIADVRDDAVSVQISEALGRFGKGLDCLINNAGIAGEKGEIESVPASEMHEMFDVHCVGALRVVKGAIGYLRQSKQPTIINISSRIGSLSKIASGALDHLKISYSGRVAKASLNMLTVCLQREFEPEGIAVFALHPGRLQTKMGSADADMPAEVGAQRILSWIETLDGSVLTDYLEPGVGSIEW